MMIQTCSTFAAPQERPVMLRTQAGGRGNGGTLIPCVICSSEDDGEAAAVSAAQAIIRLNQRITQTLNVTDQCNVSLPSLPEQYVNVTLTSIGEAGVQHG